MVVAEGVDEQLRERGVRGEAESSFWSCIIVVCWLVTNCVSKLHKSQEPITSRSWRLGRERGARSAYWSTSAVSRSNRRG